MERVSIDGPVRTKEKGSVIFLIIGWIAAIISLVRYPFVFGIVAVISGIVASKRGSRAGLALIMASIVCMAIGLLFSGVFFNYLRHALGI